MDDKTKDNNPIDRDVQTKKIAGVEDEAIVPSDKPQAVDYHCKGDRVQVQALKAGGEDNTTARNFKKTGGDYYFLAEVPKGGSVKEDQATHTATEVDEHCKGDRTGAWSRS